jgi:ABC-2 type transport system permease protein
VSGTIVRRLIVKDLQFHWPFSVGSLLAGIATIALLPRGAVGFFVGWIGLLIVLVLLGIFTVIAGVIGERKEKVLLFVLSLPVSTKQYLVAKLAAHAVIFLLPWAILTTMALVVIANTGIPDGTMPIVAIVLLWPVCYYALLLGVGLITESQAWITTVIVVCNIAPTFFIPALYQLPSLSLTNPTATAQWGADALVVLGAEIALCVLAIGAGSYVYSRKRDFV